MELHKPQTLTLRSTREVEHFVAFKVHWLPNDSHIGYLAYLLRGKPSEGLNRMEELIFKAFTDMTFNLKPYKRERIVFEEQLQCLQELTSGVNRDHVVLRLFNMPDLSSGRVSHTVQAIPLVFNLQHWIPNGDDRLKYLPKQMLVDVPEDFSAWEEEVKKITAC